MATRHIMVTFDIAGAKGGDPRYQQVDELLKVLAVDGIVQRPFGQIRLLSTKKKPLPSSITRAVSKIIGSEGGVLVVTLKRPFRFVLGTKHKKAASRSAANVWLMRLD